MSDLVHSDAKGVSLPTEQADAAVLVLTERLEKAERGSRELDALIYCSVYDGYTYRPAGNAWGAHVTHRSGVRTGLDAVPGYTTSLDAALALAERVLPGCYPGVQRNRWTTHEGPLWSAFIAPPDGQGEIEEDANTAPLALCIAILRAAKAQGAEA